MEHNLGLKKAERLRSSNAVGDCQVPGLRHHSNAIITQSNEGMGSH